MKCGSGAGLALAGNEHCLPVRRSPIIAGHMRDRGGAPRACRRGMADDTILETRQLTKEFKGFVAVKGVDLRIRRGTIHALIGPNGAGKTTCFNLLTHFLTPTRGQIFYNGQRDHRLAPGDHRPDGARALVPDLGGVSEPHRARERADRAAAAPRPLVRLLAFRAQAVGAP